MFVRRLLIVIGLLAAIAFPAAAQQGTTEIKGRVLDPQGNALPGVSVMVKNEQTGMFRQTVSDKDGVYFISGLTPGSYELSGELSGFNTFRHHDLRLEIGKTAKVDVKMQLGAVAEELTVTAAAPMIDVTSKEVGGNITSKELVELPSVNRNFIGFVALLPGVVANISTESFGADAVSVNGQDSRNNNYMVDGGNNNDDVIGQRAGTQARTPIESIQEFQVLTGQYDAEFGRTTGAVINAVTKQGTNQFKGVAFGFLQDASYTEKDFFTKQRNGQKPDTNFVQWGGNIGGPIVRDRLHFFANLERVYNKRATAINIPARPEFNATPTTTDDVWNTMIRFDGQLNASESGAIRWLRESSPQKNQIIPDATLNGTVPVTLNASREESDVDQTAVGTWSSLFGNSKLNTVRLTWTQENVAFANPGFNGNGRQQDLLKPTLVFLNFEDQQSAVAQARINNAYYIDDTFNSYVSNHDIRVGFQVARLAESSTAQDNMNGTFTFRTNKPFDPNDFSTYPERFSIRVPGASQLNLAVKYYGVFAQDKWSVSDRATVSLGLRYDLEKLPINEADNPLFTNPNDYPTDKNNISPRLGFTYNVDPKTNTVLRAGYGRFYDKTHLELVQGAVTGGVFSNSFVTTLPTSAADPGPSKGQRPTDPFLANGPIVDRALLAQRFPPGSRIKNTGTVILDSPDRVIPYTDQFSVGASRQITTGLALSVDFIHASGQDQFMSREYNPGTRSGTGRTDPVTRVNKNFTGSVLVRGNTGETTYNAAEFQVDHHLGQNFLYRISYTYSKSRGNTSGNGIPTSNFQYLDDLRLNANEGPTDFDRPHNFVLSASGRVPHTGGHLELATVTRYVSGDPLTIQNTSFDPDQNGVLFDPLPAGSYSGTGRNSITVHSSGGRNGARGPDFFQVDGRAAYRMTVAGSEVRLIGEVFNLTNRANYANPSGDVRSGPTGFLVLNSLRSGAVPRTFQFGVRLSY
ncbi:MAG TPA: TonB-dependent receptor [Thermoanaerobaculia bacterium]|nr:TonB-dependent receptor [Thermoanaerobaculia bacterium]